jgi:NADH-quinone oxidoreductase subunit F
VKDFPETGNFWIVRVGMASCGIASGARRVFEALKDRIFNERLPVTLKQTGCLGMCYNEPLIELVSPSGEHSLYTHVTPDKIQRIVSRHILANEPVHEWMCSQNEWDNFMSKQKRIVLQNCGVIDPENIQDYIAADGYAALKKALLYMTPEDIIDQVLKSGLRGRGGAGFSTGTKWSLARKSEGKPKYLICNADEGDPGAFMNRSVLESDPHSVIEGMLIAGYAIGAATGFIYCRAEYPLALQRLELTLNAAREMGYLGNNILGKGFDFDIIVRQGAGAFVCGEETALMQSIEGKRGMPRTRPPFPAQSGLWGKPTNINNVETLSIIPWIIRHGSDQYSRYGTAKSKGTRTFALAGKIARGGLVEVEFGTTIREVVLGIGGGTSSALDFKAIQMGGPSGGVVPASLADTPLDYESITATGAIMGSGGLITMDASSCMVDVARYFLNFTQDESCGKCTFCRIGTLRMLEILVRITHGQGHIEDLAALEKLALAVKQNSLCGLGQTAPNPVLTTLKYFREEYEAHILEKRCPAGKCQALISYRILADRCSGCGLCLKSCAVGAISGNKKEPHSIDAQKCVRCGICFKNCRRAAITVR